MGLSSTPTTPNETVRICVFDLRRGQREGDELDKILFFYPADLPISDQLSVIGLSEGLITFTRIFSPDAACEVIEAERHSHVFYQAEPDIWMVVEKNNVEAIWRADALRSVLNEVHSLFVMFNGSIRVLLDKDPSGELIRPYLYTFIMDYLHVTNCQHLKNGILWISAAGVMLKFPCNFSLGLQNWHAGRLLHLIPHFFIFGADLFVGKKFHLPSFRDSLRQRGTVQMLTVGREAAIEVQSLVRMLDSCCGNTQCHSLVLFHDLLVSTTLSPDDTVNMFSYATLRMSPRAMSSATSSWSYFRKGSSASSVATDSSGSHSDQIRGPQDTYLSRRPLRTNKWCKGKDGFLVTDAWNTDVSSSDATIPTILLQHSEDRMYLCAHQYKNLTVILLIPVASVSSAEQEISSIKQQILENVSLRIMNVEEKLAKGWGGENAYHVAGYRYLLVDGDRSVSRASPPAKVTTLAKDSLVAMSKLREEVDLEKARTGWDNEGREKDLEVCIRANNNAWVIARVTRGKELFIVLEKASETLLYAADAIERFSNSNCNSERSASPQDLINTSVVVISESLTTQREMTGDARNLRAGEAALVLQLTEGAQFGWPTKTSPSKLLLVLRFQAPSCAQFIDLPDVYSDEAETLLFFLQLHMLSSCHPQLNEGVLLNLIIFW
ncbi:LOW QUALITY PROTEIN: hypothetical protein V2J09_015111 [Rumex salicifolius]